MRDIRNICLIDTPPVLDAAFKSQGYSVVHLNGAPEDFFHLPEALSKLDCTPDLVLQYECLHKRSIALGLDEVDCPTLFWAVDPHLNAYWQSAYARLFDMTCSTQRGWIPRIKERGAADVRWLPTFGRESSWVDMNARSHDLAFVGRMTVQRPARQWMVDFLQEKGAGLNLAIEQNLPFDKMMELYRYSRIIPNESILGEVNFRLFEAASCGCLVLSQNLGEEQEALFEPGREFDTYADVVEFGEKLEMYLKNERLVQAMGRAAYERVQAEHLPVHRAHRIVEFALDAARNRALGEENAKWTALTICAMWEAGQITMPTKDVLSRLAVLSPDDTVAAATLRVQAIARMTPLVEDNLATLLGGELYADSLELNLVGSMTALRVGNWDGAKAFWYRHLQSTDAKNPGVPDTPIQLLTLWAKELKKRDRIMRAGFSFDPAVHIPVTATECLVTILADEPEHLPTLRLLDTVLRPVIGLEQTRVGFLSILTLHERNDWRLAFEIALANLKSYRFESGLEEMHLAREIARAQAQEQSFARALAARDTPGLIAAKLG